jgi:hypothetical protein
MQGIRCVCAAAHQSHVLRAEAPMRSARRFLKTCKKFCPEQNPLSARTMITSRIAQLGISRKGKTCVATCMSSHAITADAIATL